MASIVRCPEHGESMQRSVTQYGGRWDCTVNGCTVACWEGSTSTPADAETRSLRHQCHELFDPLWRDKTKFSRRPLAYAWLQSVMNLPKHEAHIGMFNADQCRQLLDALKEWEVITP